MAPTLDQMKPFSISRYFFHQVVVPLYKSGNVLNIDGLDELLKKLHCSLWAKSGIPMGFSGAVAGNFQEILDGYSSAVVGGFKVQYGAKDKVGGDTVKEIEVGKGVQLATSQFKVTASHAGEAREHLAKAAWQLTGAGGETPVVGSRKIIELVIQDDTMVEPQSDMPMKDFEFEDWKQQIEEAFHEGYPTKKKAPRNNEGGKGNKQIKEDYKTAEELCRAVDYVYVTTAAKRFIFMVGGASLGIMYMGGGPPTRAAYVFKGGNFERHWLWLTTDYWNSIKYRGYDYGVVQKVGVGTGAAKTPESLPHKEKE